MNELIIDSKNLIFELDGRSLKNCVKLEVVFDGSSLARVTITEVIPKCNVSADIFTNEECFNTNRYVITEK